MPKLRTVMVYKEDMAVRVNATDAYTWLEQGWSDKEPAKAESKEVDLSKLKKTELIELAVAKELGTAEELDALKKAEIQALLEEPEEVTEE